MCERFFIYLSIFPKKPNLHHCACVEGESEESPSSDVNLLLFKHFDKRRRKQVLDKVTCVNFLSVTFSEEQFNFFSRVGLIDNKELFLLLDRQTDR